MREPRPTRRCRAAQIGSGEHQSEHQCLVVDAGHQMHEQQQVARTTTARSPRPHRSAAPGGGGPHDQPGPHEQHHQPVAGTRGDDVLAGERRMPRPIRGTAGRRVRGLAPGLGTDNVNVVQAESGAGPILCGSSPMRAIWLCAPNAEYTSLAVHRRGDEQRPVPTTTGAVSWLRDIRRGPSANRPSAEPRQRHHHHAGGGHSQRHGLDA